MYVDSNPAADGGMRTRVCVLRGGDAMNAQVMQLALNAFLALVGAAGSGRRTRPSTPAKANKRPQEGGR